MMLVSSFEAASRLLIEHLNLTIKASGHRGSITDDEIAGSLCEEFKIKDSGKVERESVRVPPKALVRFSITYLQKFYEIEDERLFQTNGWNCLCKAIEIRHRVTHPATVAMLNVSDEEIQQCRVALVWYTRAVVDLMRYGAKAAKSLIGHHRKS